MKVGSVKRLYKTDLPGAPGWVDKLLDHFNTAVEGLLTATNGRLTPGDNLQGLYVELDVHTRSDYTSGGWDTISFACPVRARHVAVSQLTLVADVYTPVQEPRGVDWIQLGTDVQVRWLAGLDDSQRYAVRLLVLA